MNFEFLKDSKVWIVYSGTTYRLHITTITFSQAFKQDNYETRTLHSNDQQYLFEGSVINTANPANFSLSMPMVDETTLHQHIPINLLLDHDSTATGLRSFTLYIDPNSSLNYMYKIENCVITSGTFNIPRTGIMTVEIEGQGTKISRVLTSSVTLTDSAFVEYPTFGVAKTVEVKINSNILDNIVGVTMEVQNDIEWTKYNTVHDSLSVTNASDSMYPSSYSLGGRVVSGNINQYISSDSQSNSNIFSWNNSVPVHIKAGLSTSNYQLKAELTPCSFTNRIGVGDVFSQAYDFRLLSGASALTTQISHYNIT
jgi:hypothetical protein